MIRVTVVLQRTGADPELSRSGFGDRIDRFERDLTAALLDANPSGVFRERLETEVLIAQKR